MKLNRIQVKYFLEDASRPDLGAVVPIFHRWIQDQALDEMLIDVANYAHVVDGPGVILIAHEADYAIDLAHGRPGLLYTRKRGVPEGMREALSLALHQVLRAASLLEEDAGYRFRTDDVEIIFPDRLQLPNRPESLDLVQTDISNVIAGVYGTADPNVAWTRDDERLPFGVQVRLPVSPRPAELAERMALSR